MSKEEAIEILSEMRSEYNLFGDEEEATRYHVLSLAIKEMNAEPVRHGRWIFSEDRYWKTCTECGAEVDVSMGLGMFVDGIEVDEMKYCPNCGAKMDEAEE